MQRQRDGVWKRILALPLCACLLVSCSMRTVRVQNPVLSSGQEAPTVEPATQSWKSVAFIPVVSSVEVDLTTGETITGKFRSADEARACSRTGWAPEASVASGNSARDSV